MTASGWPWIYAGLALALVELVTPGFILCFFGLADAPLAVGADVKVVAQQNLTMKVEAL